MSSETITATICQQPTDLERVVISSVQIGGEPLDVFLFKKNHTPESANKLARAKVGDELTLHGFTGINRMKGNQPRFIVDAIGDQDDWDLSDGLPDEF